MGDNIHVTIEHQDCQGHWWTVLSKAVYWTDWWGTHVRGLGPGTHLYRHPDFLQPTATSRIWERDYDLFAALSNLRGENRLAPLLGLPQGQSLGDAYAAHGGWPADASHAVCTYYVGSDHHTHGACSFADLDGWRAVLSRRTKRVSDTQRDQRHSVLRWAANLDACLPLAFGDGARPAVLDRPFMLLDEGEDDEAVVDHFAPVGLPSAHAYAAYLAERKTITDWRAVPRDRLRALFCYDN